MTIITRDELVHALRRHVPRATHAAISSRYGLSCDDDDILAAYEQMIAGMVRMGILESAHSADHAVRLYLRLI